MFELEYFQTIKGQKPVEEFINSQETKMQAKIFRQLELLKEFGPQLGEPFSRLVSIRYRTEYESRRVAHG